ncbi:MAG: copper-binding protein [Verrucomicrobia bacterium]|nr:copper-binding protein [Verrucomicrobiota bacterium]
MNLRLPALLFLALTAFSIARAAGESPAFIVQNDVIPSPAGPGAVAPFLTNAPDGTVYLVWIEPEAAAAGSYALRFATLDAAKRRWNSVRTIATGTGWRVKDFDTPQLAAGSNGRLTALWYLSAPAGEGEIHDGDYRAVVSTTRDDGVTWTPPVPLSRESDRNAFASLVSLPDGHTLAAWLDGRAHHAAGDVQALYARLLDKHDGASAKVEPDQLVDPRVCGSGQTTLAAFPDGSVLLAYRGRGTDEVRDIRTARYQDGKWQSPSTLNPDGWKIAGDPVNGPALAARSTHVAAAWFTAAGDARINLSTSGNAGVQWLAPNRVDDIAPVGRVGLVMLDDLSQLVSWVEHRKTGNIILLRRVSPRGSLDVPVQLGRTTEQAIPRLARVKDSDVTPAQLLLVHIQPDSNLVTRLITLPDASHLAEDDPCGCDPRPDEERGFALKGRIVAVDLAHGTLTVRHDDIPGLMKSAATVFKAEPDVLHAAQPDQVILARIERNGVNWSIFSVHTLVMRSSP